MNILRLIIFQALWYIFIKLGYLEISYTFPFIAILFTAIDKKLFNKDESWYKYLSFTLFLLVSGLVVDSTLLNTNFIQFENYKEIYSPFYMWSIWIIFHPYYQIAFNKFKNKNLIASSCGFLFAPFSYYSGSKLGNLEIQEPSNLIAVAVLWAIFFPISINLYFKLNSKKELL
jgi:hypothetical protein